MTSKRLKKLGTGIYQDEYSIRAIVNIAAGRKEKRFEKGTSLREIQQWRNQTKVKIEAKHPQRRAGVMGRGTFAADVKRYIKTLAISSWKSRRSELRAWSTALGRIMRRRVTQEHAERVIKRWVDAGVPPKTIGNRAGALSAMYHKLDGENAWTPVDDVSLPKVRKRLPDYVPPERIIAIERTMRKQERAGELEPAWRGRFMVLNACGARPVHLKLTEAKDVDLKNTVWRIQGAKDGNPIRLPLNTEQVAAWKVFIAANAWGTWDDTKYAKIVRAAGWPEGIDPYVAKHSFGQDLADAGIDHDTIADIYGHTDTKTTRIYVGRAKLQRAVDAIEGRLGWGKKRKRSAVDVGRDDGIPSKQQIAEALAVLQRAAQSGS